MLQSTCGSVVPGENAEHVALVSLQVWRSFFLQMQKLYSSIVLCMDGKSRVLELLNSILYLDPSHDMMMGDAFHLH